MTLWTVAPKLLSLGFSRQEYWSGLSFPPPGNLCDPRMEPESPACISCIGRQLLYHLSYQGSPLKSWVIAKEITQSACLNYLQCGLSQGKKRSVFFFLFSLWYLTWNSRNTSFFSIKKVLSTRAPSCHETFCAQDASDTWGLLLTVVRKDG